MKPLALYSRIRAAISPEQERGILNEAAQHLAILKPRRGKVGTIFQLFSSVGLLIEMLRDRTFSMAWTSKVGILAGLVYFVLPADTVPDLVPILGFVDDVAVVGFVMRALGGELRRFADHRSLGGASGN